MSTPRDPRVDPKAGDVIYRDGSFRTVIRKRGHYVVFNQSPRDADESEPINSWRNWASKAEVKVTAV